MNNNLTKEKNSSNNEVTYDRFNESRTQHVLNTSTKQDISYTAKAGWADLTKDEKPAARMFHVAYTSDDTDLSQRPLTFVMNGGPGASSAYLHLGALGPKRVCFESDGTVPKPPVKLVDNNESWLSFTDLVFIDPIGTGFSRVVSEKSGEICNPEKAKEDSAGQSNNTATKEEYWEIEKDLNSIGEFIQRYLSENFRWGSPIFIAGESYGGFRVAKLARSLQEKFGIGLNGIVLISPAIEFSSFMQDTYSVTHWVERLPALAATAFHHKKANVIDGTNLESFLCMVESFAIDKYSKFLIQGELMPCEIQEEIFQTLSNLLGVSLEFIKKFNGRVPIREFARELLRDERLYCGLYDSSVTTVDPFPDRQTFEGPDPTLFALDRVYQSGINLHLRENLELDTGLRYQLLNLEISQKWKNLKGEKIWSQAIGSMDDLRYAISLNPHMHIHLSHGYFDLVTPYFASRRLANHMRLTDIQKEKLQIETFLGGHMFYSWESSRKKYYDRISLFYEMSLKN